MSEKLLRNRRNFLKGIFAIAAASGIGTGVAAAQAAKKKVAKKKAAKKKGAKKKVAKKAAAKKAAG